MSFQIVFIVENNSYSVTFLNRAPIFEWCDSKTGSQKDMCFNKIELHAQNTITVLGSIVNILWEEPM